MFDAAFRPLALVITYTLALGAASCSSPNDEPTWRSRTGSPLPGAASSGETLPATTPTGPSAPSPTAPPPATSTPAVAGSMTLRSAIAGFVMLGDGARFFSAIDDKAPVTFTDPSIVGPQNVTFVQVFAQTGMFSANTLVGVSRPDVTLSTTWGAAQKHASIKGVVAPWYNAPSAPVHFQTLVARPRYGYNTAELATPGAFELEVTGFGAPPTEIDLLAMQYDGVLPAFGLRTIALPSSATPLVFDQQDIVVDHRADVPVDVKLTNAEQYANAPGGANELYVSLFQRRGDSAFWTTSSPASAGTLRVYDIASTGPFARYTPYVRVRANNVPSTTGDFEVSEPRLSNVHEVVLPLPADAPRLTAPKNRPAGEIETELPPQEKITWSNTSAGELVSVVIECSSVNGPNPAASSWLVIADGATHEFQPFVLPAGVGTTRFFTRGAVRVSVGKMRFRSYDAASLLGAPPDDQALATADGYRMQVTRSVLE